MPSLVNEEDESTKQPGSSKPAKVAGDEQQQIQDKKEALE